MKNFLKSRTIQSAIILAIVTLLGVVLTIFYSKPTSQLIGSGDIVQGNKTENNNYATYPAREIDPVLIENIRKCSNPNHPYIVKGVVESSLISGPTYDETDKFKDILAQEIKAQSSTIIYRSGAIVPDGIKVWKAGATNVVYVGQNSISGKTVECINEELKLGFAGFELRNFEFEMKSDGYPIMEFEGGIYDHENAENEEFSIGAFAYADGKWRPGINIMAR